MECAGDVTALGSYCRMHRVAVCELGSQSREHPVARELERHLRADKILLGRPEWRIYVDEQVFKV